MISIHDSRPAPWGVALFCMMLGAGCGTTRGPVSVESPPPWTEGPEAVWIEAAIPADAVLVGRVDLHDVLDSPLGEQMFQDLRKNYDKIDSYLGSFLGFGLSQIDSVWFAAGADQKGLTLLRGTFELDAVRTKLHRMWGWESVPHDNIPQVSLFRSKEKEPMLAALLSTGLIAVGNQDEVEKLLAVWQQPKAPEDPHRPGVQRVRAGTIALTAASLPPHPFSSKNHPDVQLIEEAWLEGRIDTDVHLSLHIATQNDDVAQGLEKILAGLLQILKQHPDIAENPAYLDAVGRAALVRKDTGVQLNTTVSGPALMENRKDP